MARNLVATVIITLFVGSYVLAADSLPQRTINLDRPGTLEALQRNNPAHYQKIKEIMAGLFSRSDSEVPHWIQTTFSAGDVSYVPVLLTSDPPKRRLSFALDNTRYQAVVILTHLKPEFLPTQ